MSNPQRNWPLWLAIIGCIGAIAWLSADYLAPPSDDAQFSAPKEVITSPEAQPEPRYPLTATEEPASTDTTNESTPVPEPEAVDDDFMRAELVDVFGAELDDVLLEEDLAYRLVVSLDNLTSQKPARRLWPVTAEVAPFVAVPADADSYYTSPDNYARYDTLTGLLTSAEPAALAAVYRSGYPLLQETYQSLGYPDGYLNDRVVGLIDHLLSTPLPLEPVRLVRPGVLYEYADPNLEALSSGQKLLLRAGPDNGAQLRQWLEDIRGQVVQ